MRFRSTGTAARMSVAVVNKRTMMVSDGDGMWARGASPDVGGEGGGRRSKSPNTPGGGGAGEGGGGGGDGMGGRESVRTPTDLSGLSLIGMVKNMSMDGGGRTSASPDRPSHAGASSPPRFGRKSVSPPPRSRRGSASESRDSVSEYDDDDDEAGVRGDVEKRHSFTLIGSKNPVRAAV